MSESLPPLVLVVTTDPVVHEQVRVAAAAAGATCRAVPDPAAAEASPAVAVVVDAGLPGCRAGSVLVPDAVRVVAAGTAPHPPGALELPARREELAARLVLAIARAGDGRADPGDGLVVGVVGSVGGAGTSTLALALTSAGGGRLVDADAVRSGTVVATGRGAPTAPAAPGAGWGEAAPTPAALADDLDRGRRESPLVVVDLPSVASGTVWRRADAAVLVAPDTVAAALTARAAVRHLRQVVPRLVVVVRRRRRGGPGCAAVGDVVGVDGPVPVVGWRPHEALVAAADAGTLDEAVRRGPTAVAARAVLGLLVHPR